MTDEERHVLAVEMASFRGAITEQLKTLFSRFDKMEDSLREGYVTKTEFKAVERQLIEMQGNQRWAVRVVLGTVFLALLSLIVIKPV